MLHAQEKDTTSEVFGRNMGLPTHTTRWVCPHVDTLSNCHWWENVCFMSKYHVTFRKKENSDFFCSLSARWRSFLWSGHRPARYVNMTLLSIVYRCHINGFMGNWVLNIKTLSDWNIHSAALTWLKRALNISSKSVCSMCSVSMTTFH